MILYSHTRLPERSAILALFEAVNWESAQYPAQLYRSIAASECVLTAWSEAQLVGIMTAISDGGMNVFFPYLLIDPAFQGRGIGKAMTTRMLAQYAGSYRKILICNEDKAPFYEKCGFRCCTEQRPMMLLAPPASHL